MIFLRIRTGNYLTFGANKEKPNVKWRSHQTLNCPFCLFPQSLNSAIMWLSQLLHGVGRGPIFGKTCSNFLGKKNAQKRMPFCHTPTFSIFTSPFSFMLVFCMQLKLLRCSSFTFLLIFLILHAQKIRFGVVQQVAKEYFVFWEFMGVVLALVMP